MGSNFEDENSTVIVNATTAPNANGATDSGAVYIYRRTGSSWARQAYIKAANAEASDQFGDSVMLSGDTLTVGANFESENSTVIVNGTTLMPMEVFTMVPSMFTEELALLGPGKLTSKLLTHKCLTGLAVH